MKEEVRIMPPHKGMVQAHLRESGAAVDLAFTRRSDLLSRYDFSQLIQIAKLETAVPARTPVSSGRTVYVYVEPDTLPLTSIKLKGAAGLASTVGLESKEFPMTVFAPRPNEEYNANSPSTPHLFVDENLRLSTVANSGTQCPPDSSN